MPIPTPQTDETRNNFMNRCVSTLAHNDPELASDRRVAICFQQFERRKKVTIKASINVLNPKLILKKVRTMAQALKKKNNRIDINFDLSEIQEDKDNSLLFRNVAIMGNKSVDRKGAVIREYTPTCLQNAVAIFEGAGAYIDHPEPTKRHLHRSLKDMYGIFKNVRAKLEEGKLRGDLLCLDSPIGQHVASIIRTCPEAVGNSIHASGKMRLSGRKQIIEEIFPRTEWGTKSSVDLVNDPATTQNVYESRTDSSNVKETSNMEMQDLTLTELREQRPDLFQKILQEGAGSRDEEVKTLKADKTALEEEKVSLTNQVDAFKLKEDQHSVRDTIDAMLKESKLPPKAITDTFKNTLYNLSERKDGDKTITVEDQAKALIEERKQILGLKGVQGNGDDHHPLNEDKHDDKDNLEGSHEVIASISEYRM
jgi:hypothetical protein